MQTMLIILSLIGVNLYGQISDSSIYFLYKDKKNVISVQYEKTYYPCDSLKHEGWMVNELPTLKSEISNHADSINGSSYTFGVWKFYYKNGKISSIDSNGVSDTAIKRQYFYAKSGCLKKIIIIKPLTTTYKTNDMKFAGPVKRYEWLKRIKYDCNGILIEEFFSPSQQPSGTWKYYKKGKLIKTKAFDGDGRCIKTERHHTE